MSSTILGSVSLKSGAVLIKAVLQLVTMGILARYLSPAEFGLVAAANLVVMFLQMLSEAGVSSVLIHRDNISKPIIAAALHVSLLMGVLFLIPLIFLADVIATFLNMEDLVDLLKILSIGFILIAFYKIPETLLQREMRFKPLLLIDLLSFIFAYSMPAIMLAINGYGALSVVLASVFQPLFKVVVLGFYRPMPIFCRYRMSEVKTVVSFGTGVTLNRVCNYVYRNIDKILVGKIFGQEALGIYHLAVQLIILPVTYIGDVLEAVFFPTLSRLKVDKAEFYLSESILFKVAFYIVGLISLIFYFYSDLIVSLMYGPGWDAAYIIVSIMGFGCGFRVLTRISDIANRASGQVYSSAKIKLIISLVMSCLVYAATFVDLKAVAYTVFSVSILAAFLLMRLAFKFSGVSFVQFLAEAKSTVLSLLSFYLLIFVGNKIFMLPSESIYNLFLIIPISAIVLIYGYFLYKNELKILFKIN